MRVLRALALLVPLSLASAAGAVPPPAPADEGTAKLREQVLDGALMEANRLKAALALERADPELLGNALLEMGEKQKSAGNLPFLVAFTMKEEARHLRYVAAWAAWSSAPEAAAAAYLDKVGTSEDEKGEVRAVEAAGFVAGAQKDRAALKRLLEIAKGPQATAAIEAARAVNRSMDRRMLQDAYEAACGAKDNHARKHLVWAAMDLCGSDRQAQKTFEGMRGKPGEIGRNASECAAILLDKQAVPFEWKPDALKDAPAWWKVGRPKDLKCEFAVNDKDKETKDKLQSWFDEAKKGSPAWGHYAASSLHRIARRTDKAYEIYDLKKKTLSIDSSEILQCDNPWKGSYVLCRDSGIAFSAQMGEPSRDHRGWEPAYVDLHSYMKACRQAVGKLQDWVDECVAKRPWP
jgi:hypothetical protein